MDNQNEKLKFCKYCGEKISEDAVICPKCGRQVEEIKKDSNNEQIIINNNNSVSASASASAVAGGFYGRPKNKWIALALCIFTICGHKFYEGKFGMGIIYLCTLGFLGIGVIADFISLLFKPNPYYV